MTLLKSQITNVKLVIILVKQTRVLTDLKFLEANIIPLLISIPNNVTLSREGNLVI